MDGENFLANTICASADNTSVNFSDAFHVGLTLKYIFNTILFLRQESLSPTRLSFSDAETIRRTNVVTIADTMV